jgi:hypothetical protein
VGQTSSAIAAATRQQTIDRKNVKNEQEYEDDEMKMKMMKMMMKKKKKKM